VAKAITAVAAPSYTKAKADAVAPSITKAETTSAVPLFTPIVLPFIAAADAADAAILNWKCPAKANEAFENMATVSPSFTKAENAAAAPSFMLVEAAVADALVAVTAANPADWIVAS